MTTNHTVLYADDDNDDLELVKEVFVNHLQNVELVCVKNGLLAVQFLKNLPENHPSPCLIILDINMPVLNGKQALVEIRNIERFNDTPIILFTTSTHPIDKSFANKYNAGFITKPIDYTQLNLIAEEFMDHCTDNVKSRIRKFSL